ncbi:MAG: glutathione S-transferase N-terminal domain-containing protein [Pseudomonadota bacterium]
MASKSPKKESAPAKAAAAPKVEPLDYGNDADGFTTERIRNMKLYAGVVCPHSHRTRLVLSEKDISIEIEQVDPGAMPEDLRDLNPYGDLPVLVDRGLVLYNSAIIMEYLDERFPHPPLMPVDPINRAQARLMLWRIDRDWFSLHRTLTEPDKKSDVAGARKTLRDGLVSIAPLFQQHEFVFGEGPTLVDCALSVLLWRLPVYGIELPAPARPILRYAERMFARPAFRSSLSEQEFEMRHGQPA